MAIQLRGGNWGGPGRLALVDRSLPALALVLLHQRPGFDSRLLLRFSAEIPVG